MLLGRGQHSQGIRGNYEASQRKWRVCLAYRDDNWNERGNPGQIKVDGPRVPFLGVQKPYIKRPSFVCVLVRDLQRNRTSGMHVYIERDS